jgi:hypothetical protein
MKQEALCKTQAKIFVQTFEMVSKLYFLISFGMGLPSNKHETLASSIS